MNAHTHTDDFTGLEARHPATTPARDATHFRQIRTARDSLTQAEADLREAVASARYA